MQTKEIINKTKTDTFKEGDKVVMHSCYEANLEEYKNIEWTCLTSSYIDKSGNEVVFLDGFSGCFFVKYLKIFNH
ncbi:hypothetical protein M2T28_20005 [Elizabethkingia miricola]|uniref:hypothetical protein n=1 Tax=Elizabethkingia miricola TaxID=172045 RepID=UPI00201907D2|nr:hypothetical protein [Elizabethkingia miricola]MCL1654911.1 hypothetical protein [Elizabethkingia miricola]